MTQPPKKIRAKDLRPVKEPPADTPARFDESEVAALQALQRGTASSHQQQIALKWIINEASRAYTPQFRKDARETDFGLGRAFVGQQIIGILKVDMIRFEKPPIVQTPTKQET